MVWTSEPKKHVRNDRKTTDPGSRTPHRNGKKQRLDPTVSCYLHPWLCKVATWLPKVPKWKHLTCQMTGLRILGLTNSGRLYRDIFSDAMCCRCPHRINGKPASRLAESKPPGTRPEVSSVYIYICIYIYIYIYLKASPMPPAPFTFSL